MQPAWLRAIDCINSWFRRDQGWNSYGAKKIGEIDTGSYQLYLVLHSSNSNNNETFISGRWLFRKPHLVLSQTLSEYSPRIKRDSNDAKKWYDRFIQLDTDDAAQQLALPYLPVSSVTIRPFVMDNPYIELQRKRIKVQPRFIEDPSMILVIAEAGFGNDWDRNFSSTDRNYD